MKSTRVYPRTSAGAGPASMAQRDRERQRERERSQRAAAAVSLSGLNVSDAVPELPKFGEPITQAEDDETTRQIKSMLGDFNDFAQIVIKSHQTDHPSALGISSREVKVRKVEQIFNEMKNSIEPITGLDDLDENSSNLTPRLSLPLSTTSKYPSSSGSHSNSTSTNSHSQQSALLNTHQSAVAAPSRKSHPDVATTSANSTNSNSSNHQSSHNSTHNSTSSTHHPLFHRSPAPPQVSQPPPPSISTATNSHHNHFPRASPLSDDEVPHLPPPSSVPAKIPDLQTSSDARKRKITPIPPSTAAVSAPPPPQPPSQPPVSSTFESRNSSSSAIKNGKLSQPVKTKSTDSESSDSDDGSASSSDNDSDDSEESSASSDSSADDSNSGSDTRRKATNSRANNRTNGSTKTKAKKQSSVESIDGHRNAMAVPSSAGLGPPTNNVNVIWDLDNFIDNGNKQKNLDKDKNKVLDEVSSSSSSSSSSASSPTYTPRDTQPAISNNTNSTKDKESLTKAKATVELKKAVVESGSKSLLDSKPLDEKLVSNGQMIVSLSLNRLNRVPCVDRNGNIAPNIAASNSSSSSKTNRSNEHLNEENCPPKRKPITTPKKEAETPTKRIKETKKEVKAKEEKKEKSLLVNIPIKNKKGSAVVAGSTPAPVASSSSNTTTPNKKSKTGKEEVDRHSSSNHRDNHMKGERNTPTQSGSSLRAKSSPIVGARSSPSVSTSSSRATTSSSARALFDSPTLLNITNRYHPCENETDALARAKTLKRQADKEHDRQQQMSLYIEAVLYFIQTGMKMETMRSDSELEKAYQMYKETFNLLKQTTNKFIKSPFTRLSGNGENNCSLDIKLTILSYRCQSLLMLKLNRMRQKEMHDNKELISGFMAEPTIQAVLSHPGPSSTSSSVSMPANTLQACSKQLTLLQTFQTVIEQWTKTEAMIEKNSNVKEFFGQLHADRRVGYLNISSSFEHLINYTLNGIKNLNL